MLAKGENCYVVRSITLGYDELRRSLSPAEIGRSTKFDVPRL
jgi:hypothetical protein